MMVEPHSVFSPIDGRGGTRQNTAPPSNLQQFGHGACAPCFQPTNLAVSQAPSAILLGCHERQFRQCVYYLVFELFLFALLHPRVRQVKMHQLDAGFRPVVPVWKKAHKSESTKGFDASTSRSV